MPALSNPRHERFAQCIVAGLAGKARIEQAQSTAYRAAGYLAKEGNSAEAAASRLLRRVKPILDRVREIQAQEAKRRRLTVEDIVDELEDARGVAKANDQAAAMATATLGKAKILGLSVDRVEQGKPGDFSQAQSTADIADAYLKAHNPELRTISDDMREMALAALSACESTLAAIAHGQPAQSNASH